MTQILIKTDKLDDDTSLQLKELISESIEFYKTYDIWNEEISEIIMTDNLAEAINVELKKYNKSDVPITKEKETFAVAKNIDFEVNGNTETKIFISLVALLAGSLQEILLHQIYSSYSDDYIPDFFYNTPIYYSSSGVDEIIQYLTKIWYKVVLEFQVLKDFNKLTLDTPENAEQYLEAFKRKIKGVHNNYQATGNVDKLRIEAIEVTHIFILRCLEHYLKAGDVSHLGEFNEPIKAIIHQILEIVDDDVNRVEYDLKEIELIFKKILSMCYLDLSGSLKENEQAGIIVTEDPHLLFKGSYLETELRFVAFIDILGFKKIISDYDQNEYSTALKILKKALEEAISKSVQRIEEPNTPGIWGVNPYYKNFKALIEYRMFSDCFCISLPYFNNPKDFAVQFGSLSLTIRIFQLLLLQKGILVRGGISFGSYYSDENMLFSGALVKAYNLESKHANFPRIIIDEEITDKLLKQNPVFISLLGLKNALVKDTNYDDYAFLNSLNLDEGIKLNLKEVTDNIEDLYKELNVEHDYSSLLSVLKNFSQITPEFSADLSTPFEVKKMVEHIDKQTIREYLESEISYLEHQEESKIDDSSQKDNRKTTPKEKNDWLLQFLNWTDAKPYNKERHTFINLWNKY
ncbi:MAG: hypothetical protein V4642_01265 [Bacteroidota bacterium]